MPATDKKVIIFGAGMHGQQTLKMLGYEKVAYFLDNNAAKYGTFCNGKEIVGFDKIEANKDKYHFVIVSQYISSMKQDLAAHGISDFEVFRNYLFSYYETPELVFNPIVLIDITNACTERCSNCTRFCGNHKKPFFMDFETFKRAVDSMEGFPGLVALIGGEPTLHPEFERFMEYLQTRYPRQDRQKR
ncbi:radical SAM protein [Butyrivibrio fibrisolvens]|uniref:Radical SAM core domain-containing protein n=1 Tax=Butyrivibrio fibrisolvens TaxID=831 RepID=A0A317G8R2_BUTFI|nr:radical SAM protein [Butyrivibrio fibrisolvens]PWT29253.1 hypothetical protein CPT75_20190 [Butyrivibrio fibrisolvens]